MLAMLCYVCLGVASPLEGAIFTTLQGMGSIPVLFVPPCLLFAAVVTLLFKPVQTGGSPLRDSPAVLPRQKPGVNGSGGSSRRSSPFPSSTGPSA